MSGYTTTIFEELYSFYGAATTTTPTAAAVSMIGAYPPIVIPGGYFTAMGAKTSSLYLKVGGQMTVTATIPTWLMGVQFTSAQPPAFVAAGANVLAATATFTPTAGTGAYFQMEANIGIRAIAPGAASTLATVGMVSGSLLPSPGFTSLPATNVAATNATWETDLQYFLWPYLTLGAATAGNTVTVQYVKLYGEN